MVYFEKWSLRKFIYIFIFMAIAAAAVVCLWAGGDVAPAAGGPVIRFHVIANSDSPGDQALKLKARDAVIQAMAPVLADAGDIEEARARVDANLDLIRATAARALWENGCSHQVRVLRGNYDFPEKTYRICMNGGETADLIFPAGEYEAVRVIIGGGKGANWWCVLFPPLCFVNPAQENPSGQRDLKPEKDPAEIPAFRYDQVMPEKAGTAPAVEYRLKVVEWYRQVRDWGLRAGD